MLPSVIDVVAVKNYRNFVIIRQNQLHPKVPKQSNFCKPRKNHKWKWIDLLIFQPCAVTKLYVQDRFLNIVSIVGILSFLYLYLQYLLSKYRGYFLFRTIRVEYFFVTSLMMLRIKETVGSICDLWDSVPQVKIDGPWKQ